MKDVSGSSRTFYLSRSVALLCAISSGLWGLAGCGSSGGASVGGGGGTSGPTPLVAGGAGDVFVIQYNSGAAGTSILDFAAGSSGSVTPKGTLGLGSGFIVDSVASDSLGEIYVGGYTPSTDTRRAQNTIYVFAAGAAGATGVAPPVKAMDTEVQPSAMTVDAAGNIYLAGNGAVEKILGNNTAIFFESTSFTFVTGIAVDGSGNVYVSVLLTNQGSNPDGAIEVFAAGSQNAVTPVRTIATNGVAYGVALDHAGNIYTPVDVQTQGTPGHYPTSSAALVQYAGGTTGSATPLKTISASVFTDVSGVQVDAAGNLYLLNTITNGTGSSATLIPEVMGFNGSVTGSVSPAITLSSSAWNNTGDSMAVH